MGKRYLGNLKNGLFVFVYLLAFVFLTPIFSQAHPKDFTTLLEYDSSPLGDRTPLILIHGVHGNQWENGVDDINSPHLPYWQKFQLT